MTYNLDTIDDIPGDIDRACLSVGADGWTAHFGTWDQCAPILQGFDSNLDAWAFIVASTGIDPQAGIPDRLKHWTKRHPAPEPEPEWCEECNLPADHCRENHEQAVDQPSYAQFSLDLEDS